MSPMSPKEERGREKRGRTAAPYKLFQPKRQTMNVPKRLHMPLGLLHWGCVCINSSPNPWTPPLPSKLSAYSTLTTTICGNPFSHLLLLFRHRLHYRFGAVEQFLRWNGWFPPLPMRFSTKQSLVQDFPPKGLGPPHLPLSCRFQPRIQRVSHSGLDTGLGEGCRPPGASDTIAGRWQRGLTNEV